MTDRSHQDQQSADMLPLGTDAADLVEDYVVDGIHLQIPTAVLGDNLRKVLKSGQYESAEAAALRMHLKPEDRFLEFGSGTGYLASIASRIVGADAVTGVEAIPAMAKTARSNLARNGFEAAKLHWGAAVPEDFADPFVEFSVSREFWASGIGGGTGTGQRKNIQVPVLRFSKLLAQSQATVMVCDIEGGELTLFDQDLPDHLRLIIMELHLNVYGGAGMAQIFQALARKGFAYYPWGSRGAVVVFERF